MENYSRSYYLDIFKKPEYYYLCFERDVSLDCKFAIDIYKKVNKIKPKNILSFESCTSEHARYFWNNGYKNITCFNTNPIFSEFTLDKFNLKSMVNSFTSDINSDLLVGQDVVLWLFDHIAYTKNPEDALNIINNLYTFLNEKGILIIQSNSGVDLSYLDYSTVYDNSSLDKSWFGKIIWSFNKPEKNTWSKSNKITKKIQIFNKSEMKISDEFSFTSVEWVYNKEDMSKLCLKSYFKGRSFFFSDFKQSEYDLTSYETISVFVK